MLKKKIWASFQRIIDLFTQKFVTKLSKMGLGFGIRKNLFWIPDPGLGVKRAPYPGSRIWIRNTACNHKVRLLKKRPIKKRACKHWDQSENI
jgi:hypothetical protein